MDDNDFINLYLTSFDGIGIRGVEKERRNDYSDNDLIKKFQKKYPEIANFKFLKWKESFLEKISKENIKVISHKDPLYPSDLLNIKDYPRYLFIKGNMDIFKRDIFAVVGSRHPTSYGINITKNLVSSLSDFGFVIISGMALGIDKISHETSLKNGTIAVLGGGFDNIYPSTNEYLYNEILYNNGTVISEYLPEVIPHPAYFPQRSRIIAGLSKGLLVTEAAEKSGTMIAANLAFDYGKNVYAVPADVNRLNSQGCNLLIMRNIAKLVRNAQDILEDYKSVGIINSKSSNLENISSEYKEMIEHLNNGISDIDSIIIKSNKDYSTILRIISEMELEGIIGREGSEIYLKV